KAIERYKAWDSPAPSFKVKDYKGTNISLNHLHGDWIILYFWSPKSVWSLNGLIEIEKLSRRYDQLVIVCLCCYGTKKDWEDVVKNIMPMSNIHNVLLNKKSKLYRDYHVRMFPTLILINPEGNIIELHNGLIDSMIIRSLESLIPSPSS
ncbi:MAG: redoxin domain-containing protein, partial [Muribaculaceae bacterium]|nr:redoxin domain-containing protein [Muribaculaceae bacterium]